jgi:hypothetical protein
VSEFLAVLSHLRLGDEAVVVEVQASEKLFHLLNIWEVLAVRDQKTTIIGIKKPSFFLAFETNLVWNYDSIGRRKIRLSLI